MVRLYAVPAALALRPHVSSPLSSLFPEKLIPGFLRAARNIFTLTPPCSAGFMKLLFHKPIPAVLRNHNRHEISKHVYHRLFCIIRLKFIDL